ncbi:Proteasome subunit beta type-4 like protein [Argiope bruennichi]|uniref:Proteasome subunit beta n=1 Tax=Argiope bruennichi TaxID=94029 RepID=A0A8T0FVU8_ARGBR|nr:Proteasome subunit beta type-4 like protein [Argiope bruennichi]
MDFAKLYSQGSCSSSIFAKDVDNMMPFTENSTWNFASEDGVFKRTTHPIITGTSVLGLVFDEGVMIAADTLGSFGSMARFLNCPRVLKVNDQIILGAGGDFADFQYMSSVIEQQIINEECLNDGFNLKPRSLHCWLTRSMYNRRSKLDPLWNIYVVGGMQDGKPYLGLVDKIGTAFEAPSIATGYGSYLAQPLFRTRIEKNPNISEHEALDLIKHCLRILYYRDGRSFPKFTVGICTKEGVRVTDPVEIDSDWSVALLVGAKCS